MIDRIDRRKAKAAKEREGQRGGERSNEVERAGGNRGTEPRGRTHTMTDGKV